MRAHPPRPSADRPRHRPPATPTDVGARPPSSRLRLRARRRRWPSARDLCRWRLAWAAVAIAHLVVVVLVAAAPAAGAQPGTAYIPPVDAPVADPFRPPSTPYGPGNRGIEYATTPGAVVRASGAGTVLFAGPVGGALHVTVAHPDGLRTSYSFLAAAGVAAGQGVRQGDPVGTAGDRLHFGVRAGDTYLDPASLFGGAAVEVELLPTDPGPAAAATEAAALAALVDDLGGGPDLGPLGGALDWLRDRAAAGLPPGALAAYGRGLDLAADLAGRVLAPPPCSHGPPPVQPVAGRGRVALTVAGLGSSSEQAAVDDLRVGDLGYDPDRVLRFSYAGGRTPPPGGDFPDVAARPYGSVDTQGDMTAAAGRLADLVDQLLAADPEATVDLYAHSLGGLVTRLALLDLAERGADLARLGVVVTLGTPHRGADLATAVVAGNSGPVGNLGLDVAGRVLDVGIDPDAPVVRQLASGSDVVDRLAAAGLPAGVRFLSISARGDLVAASPTSRVAGAANVTVPVTGWRAHSALVGSEAATAEMSRALAGVPPGCETWSDALGDVLAGHAISFVEGHVATSVMAPG